MYFSGSKNALNFEGSYFTYFSCAFALGMYPFDRQVCKIELAVKDITEDYIRLVKNESNAINFVGKDIFPGNLSCTTSITCCY